MTSKLRRVVVAVDGSEESMNALRWSLRQLNLPNSDSSFTILHIQSPPSISTGLNPGAIPFGGPSDLEVPAFAAAIEAHQRRITEAVLQHALEICRDCSVPIKTHVEIGNSKEKICEAVEKLNADLLVMGSRSFGPVKRMFLGSVSNYCTNHAQCPVIIFKGGDC
ncbi:hypothetical protein MLD38_001003 [Melastoma candidum]|uniref:Uncharacterized protein n=1 Tax=Melastoma candidum TaxID=119954 RepID=A0ACB9SD71_9MYRT|nr:hypothetical protein MLD38_001003 [Melastoma candidum]